MNIIRRKPRNQPPTPRRITPAAASPSATLPPG